MITGLAAGLLGAPLAVATLIVCHDRWFHGHAVGQLMPPSQTGMMLLAMPVLAVLAAWLPALWASHGDPAEVLRHE
jgi:ABC-type lipoprotein release transport system permease subunit